MPRTKVPKNTSKRNREQTLEDLQAATLREFDEVVETMKAEMQLEHNEAIQQIETTIHGFMSSLSEDVLNMKMSDLAAMNVLTLQEAFKELTSNQGDTISSTSGPSDSKNKSRKISKEDEGYLTETRTSELAPPSSVIRGPLSSARPKLRRSRSATGALASVVQLQPSRMKAPTPLKGFMSEHKSRPPMRTPLDRPMGRPKAASADRITNIRPKVPIDEPLALLRYPRVGEMLVSLTGSPVAGFSGSQEPIASVNIPTSAGVLSLRPTASVNFDSRMIQQIDEETLQSLQQLQENIGNIMKLRKE